MSTTTHVTTNAIALRMWARKYQQLWLQASKQPTSTPEMCLERDIVEALAKVEEKSEELLRFLATQSEPIVACSDYTD